jgi:hypothetical protein
VKGEQDEANSKCQAAQEKVKQMPWNAFCRKDKPSPCRKKQIQVSVEVKKAHGRK